MLKCRSIDGARERNVGAAVERVRSGTRSDRFRGERAQLRDDRPPTSILRGSVDNRNTDARVQAAHIATSSS